MSDFYKVFKIYVNASDLGAGAALRQEDQQSMEDYVFFYKKFDYDQRNYSTVEKEIIALIFKPCAHLLIFRQGWF